jgi:hypothetical protein
VSNEIKSYINYPMIKIPGGEIENKSICDWESNGYRLPSEAEWQYACKAGTTGYRYGELDQIAWYDENSGGKIFFEEVAGLKRPGVAGLRVVVAAIRHFA